MIHHPQLLHHALHIRSSSNKTAALDNAVSWGFTLSQIYRAMHILDIAEDPEWTVMRAYAMIGWLNGWLMIDSPVPPLNVLSQMYANEEQRR